MQQCYFQFVHSICTKICDWMNDPTEDKCQHEIDGKKPEFELAVNVKLTFVRLHPAVNVNMEFLHGVCNSIYLFILVKGTV